MFLEIFGWLGTALIIAAYFLNSTGKFASNTLLYQGMNLVGAVGITIISFYKDALQAAALNLIWALIAAFAIIQIVRARSENR